MDKRLLIKQNEEGFIIFEILVICCVLLILPFVAIPYFFNVPNEAKSTAARNIVNTIAKECLEAFSKNDLTYSFPKNLKLTGYKIYPSDGNCKGDENNFIKARSENTKKYPTYSYNTVTGEKTCSHDGQNDELNGCSAKRKGEW
tara:strand:+ start:195 stop:626 length:432 start_codon:yes stop_codon:yes gene_type:complete